jgi:protein-ribulosamine 3-kinase
LDKESHSWKSKAERLLSNAVGFPVRIESAIPSGGGCINECFVLKTFAGKFFLKRNDPRKFSGMFECEAKGLQLLNETLNGISPKAISVDEGENEMLLILEHIETGVPNKQFWNDFAKKLATIHRHTNEYFGLDHDNYIGSLPQSNKQHPDWISFFILERIEPQLKKAIDKNGLSREIHRSFEKMFSRLSEIFPVEKPSLLHGDLWSGNYMIANDGWVRLIDPAVYFGFREMDLAMMKLFGGFDSSFFSHYHEFFPLEKDFEKRVSICNLYPLLVHVNLFGGHYAYEVRATMKQFHLH